MKVKKYEECSVELSNIENIVVIEPNNDEEQIKNTVIEHFKGLDSCNDDFKELLKNYLAKIEVKRLYVPVYSIKCMVNDDYRVSYLENGNAIVHVVCGENETRIDEETLENVLKEEVVRFEGDYHFCCSEYKGAFSNRFIHLDLGTYANQSSNIENIDIIDKFISPKILEKLTNEKVKQAFSGQGLSQAKKYILGNHPEAEYDDCKQNTKVIDCQKTLYLVPLYEIVTKYNDEEYISYIAGIEALTEFDFPRSKDFLTYNSSTRKNYLFKFILTSLMIVLLSGLGVVTALYLKDNIEAFKQSHFIISSIGVGILGLVVLIIYLLMHKKYKSKKDYILNKYEKATIKPKSLYFKSVIFTGIVDLLCIVSIVVLLVIKGD